MRRKQGAGSKSGFLASTRLQRAPVLQEARLPRLPLDAKRVGTEAGTPAAGVRTAVQAHARGALRVRANAQEHLRQGRDKVCAMLALQTTAPFDTPERSGSTTPSPRPSWVQLSGGQLASEAAAPRGRQEGRVIRRAEGEGRRGEPLSGSRLTGGFLH